jgi:hypothetical protein
MPNRIIQFQNNPYSGGAVIFDSSPYTNYFIQEQKRELAKDEALDRYFMEWDKSINPAGMRQQDTQDLINQMSENKKFYFERKKEIKNPSLDNGIAYNEWYSRNKQAESLINRSKELAEKESLINRAVIQAKQKGLPITDKVLQDLTYLRKPLNSTDWKDFDIENLDFEAKPFDQIKFTKDIFGDVKFSEKIKTEKKVPENGTILRTYETYMPDEAMPMIASRASAAYKNSPSVKEFVDYSVRQNFPQLNRIFSSKFNRNIESGEDAATAIALSFSPIGSTRDKVENDRSVSFNRGGAGKSNSVTDWVIRFKDKTENGSVEDMVNIGRELLSFKGGDKQFVNLEVNRKNKGVTVWYKPKLSSGRFSDETITQYFNPTDPNFYFKLARLFQESSGSNASLKANILKGKADYTNEPKGNEKIGNKGINLKNIPKGGF